MIATPTKKRNRRKDDNCLMLRFWARWGPHFDLAGGIACLSMLGAIIYNGVNFVHDTQAYGPEIHSLSHQTELTTARTDRMGGNIELIMRALHIKPLPKTDTERQLEDENDQ